MIPPLRTALVGFCLVLAATAAWGGPPVDVRAAGAKGDGAADDQAAIQGSIDAAARSGGVVHLPAGKYLVRTISLGSNATLDLAAGVTLIGHIRIHDVSGAAIIGHDRKTSLILGRISIRRSRGVRMRDFSQEYFSGQGYDGCSDVELRGVTIRQPPQRSGRGSAIWFGDCTDVVVSQCDFSSCDDVFCLKRSGENIHLQDSVLTGHLAAPYKIGTETDGDFRNISMTRSTIRNSDRGAVSIESVDGSHIDGVFISDIRMTNVAAPLFIRLGDRDRYGRGTAGSIRNISLHGIEATCRDKDEGIGSAIAGLPGHPVENVTLTRFRVSYRGGGSREDAARRPKELPTVYPEYDMFGALPAYGLWIRHARGLVLRDVSLDAVEPDGRPALAAEDVDGLVLDRFAGGVGATAEASVRFEQVCRALVRGPAVPRKVPLLRLLGDRSDRITLLDIEAIAGDRPLVTVGDEFRGSLRVEPTTEPVVEEFHVADARPGEPVVVRARLKNPGQAGYASIELAADDKPSRRRTLWLAAGQARELVLDGPQFYEPGEHVLRLGTAVQKIRVPDSPARFVCERMEAPSAAAAGQSFDVGLLVRNTGGRTGTEKVSLSAGGNRLDAGEITLQPGRQERMRLSARLDLPGMHVLAAGGRQRRIAINPVWIDANHDGRLDADERSFGTLADALAAAAPGDCIRLQPGRYEFPAEQLPLVVKTRGLGIASAAGAEETILEARRARDDRGRAHSIFYVAADDVTIDGLTLRGGAYDVFVDGTSGAVIQNCVVETAKRYNLALANAHAAKILNNRSRFSGIGFLAMYGGGGSLIEGNRIDDEPAGIRFVGTCENRVRDNQLPATFWYGMWLEDSHRNVIEKNRIERSRLCGLELSGSDSNQVIENSIVHSKTPAVLVNRGSKDNRFEANRFEGNRGGDVVQETGEAGSRERRAAATPAREGKVYTGGVDITTPVLSRPAK
ncbi:MAG: right-handed parallel beta-helix repeat-containing protein [Thermoguttaceae bacterium]